MSSLRIALIYNHDIPCTIGGFYLKAFRDLGYNITHFSLKDSRSIPKKFDLYFRIDHGDYLDSDISPELKPSIFYAIDTHIDRSRKHMEKFIKNYDAVLCAHYLGMKTWKRHFHKPIYWIPAACDRTLHQKDLHKEKIYDVAFVGSSGGNPRKFVLQMLKERYPKHFIGKFSFLKLSEIYSASKVGFNFSIHDDINMRIFEVMSCGALLITNDIKDPMLKLLFKESEDFITYRNMKELYSKVDYFLTREDERKEIAENGCRKVKESHAYEHRVREILEISKSLKLIF